VVRPDLSFVGFSGGAVSIAGSTSDPDGDSLEIRTTIIAGTKSGPAAAAAAAAAAAGGGADDGAASPPEVVEGSGEMVSLAGIPAGDYTLLITANDGKGGVAAGVASVKVFPADLMAVAAAAEASDAGANSTHAPAGAAPVRGGAHEGAEPAGGGAAGAAATLDQVHGMVADAHGVSKPLPVEEVVEPAIEEAAEGAAGAGAGPPPPQAAVHRGCVLNYS
jgi:hypothetical protein